MELLERINGWKARAPNHLGEDADEEDEERVPDKIRLPFPSTLPVEDRDDRLGGIEHRLREAFAFDSLRALRKALIERLALQREKTLHVRGHADNFRSGAAIKRVQDEITFIANRYRKNYRSLGALGHGVNPELSELTEAHISAANVFNYTRELGRGSVPNISWIWRQTAVGPQAQDDNWLEEGKQMISFYYYGF